MPITPLQEARALAAEMHWPGVRQLWIAIRRKGIDVTKWQVEAQGGEPDLPPPTPPAKPQGEPLAEDIDERWLLDLADLKNQKV